MSDLISRSNAIRWIKAECNPYGQPTLDYESGIKIIEHLRRMPSEQSEPVRHGRWTVTPVYIKCSECGESFMLIPQNYCPNCGARMEGEK